MHGETDWEFVFQSPSGTQEGLPFSSAFKRLLCGNGEILIASPYVSLDVLEALIGERGFRLLIDHEECFGPGGNKALLEFFDKNRRNVRSLRGLHAKVVVSDDVGMLGSANMTKNGFAHRYEMSIMVPRSRLSPLRVWFETMWEAAGEFCFDDVQRSHSIAERRNREESSLKSALPVTAALPDEVVRRHARAPRARALSAVVVGQIPTEVEVPRERVGLEVPSESCASVSSEDIETLALRVQELSNDASESRKALKFLSLGLELTKLEIADQRLHLNFRIEKCVSVTVGQRWVAWWRNEGFGSYLGLILQNFEVAERYLAENKAAIGGNFLKNGQADVPSLHIPLSSFDSLPQYVIDDWRLSIEREVKRTKRSSYLAKKTPQLGYILRDEALRDEVVVKSVSSAWWFGVNNGRIGRGHMHLSEVEPLFLGGNLIWPIGHSKTSPPQAYRRMWPGNHVLIWVGRGDSPDWGVIGTARIRSVSEDSVELVDGNRFASPVTPYPLDMIQETEDSRFLFSTFGNEFRALGDVRAALFGGARKAPITVAQITSEQFEKLIDYASRKGR